MSGGFNAGSLRAQIEHQRRVRYQERLAARAAEDARREEAAQRAYLRNVPTMLLEVVRWLVDLFE